jgi:hypothetical protein
VVRPQLLEIDMVVKEKLQQPIDNMDASKEKYGYSVLYKNAKRKRKNACKSQSQAMVETVSISEETVDTHKTEADSFSDSEDTHL